MSIMEQMREFTRWKDKKALEEAEEAAREADQDNLRYELIKYLYDDKIVDQVIDSFKLLYDHGMHEAVFEVLASKEEEIEKAVAHKESFESKSQDESTSEVDTQEIEDPEDIDWVDKLMSERYGE